MLKWLNSHACKQPPTSSKHQSSEVVGAKQTRALTLYDTTTQADKHRSCIFSYLSVVIHWSITQWHVFVKQTGVWRAVKRMIDATMASLMQVNCKQSEQVNCPGMKADN